MKLIPAGDLTSASPVLVVRWCLNKAEVEELKKRNVRHPHVLFVTVYEGGSEDRHMAPLGQMLAYLTFRRPGNHSVFAKVVWPANILKKPKAALESRVHSRVSDYRYTYRLLNHDNVGFDKKHLNFHDLKCLRDTRRMDVAVPKEHFPKEPSAWLNQTVNAGFDYPAVDQCQFRRRLLGLVPKLTLFGFWAVITTVIRTAIALFYGFFGARDINFGAIIHPWHDDIADVHQYASLCDTWFGNTKDRSRRRSKWFYVLHPLLHLSAFAGLTIIKVHYDISYQEAIVMVAGKILLATIMVVGAAIKVALDNLWMPISISVSALLLLMSWRRAKKWGAGETPDEAVAKEVAKQIARQEAELRAEQERDREYNKLGELLACNAHVAPELSALPPERQTVRLRFLALRAKVCRPFAA